MATPAAEHIPLRYRAFISYSHRDKAAADWLHRALETYRLPAKLVGTTTSAGVVPRRLTPIFRDREELSASSDLDGNLAAALRDSAFLLVICSPASARSKWVAQEILDFKRIHGEHRVLALVVAGSPRASKRAGDEDQECFPVPLRFVLGPDGEPSAEEAHPIAADIREGKDGRPLARSKLIAGLTGLRLDEVVRREAQRRNTRLTAIATAASIGMAVTGGVAIYANLQRVEAERQKTEADKQREIAEKEAAAARAASDFLVGTFALSNPGTENPKTITALTILGRSAQRAKTELADQPAIQSRMLATIGHAYVNLSLFDEARTALESSLPAIQKAGPDGAEAMVVLAETYLEQGALDKSLATVKQAEAMLGPDLTERVNIRAKAAVAEGRIRTSSSSSSDVKAGIAAFDRALAFYRSMKSPPPTAVATVLNNRGLLLSDDGQFDAAEKSLSEALAIFQKALGPGHLSTGIAWFALAQNSFNAGKLARAEREVAMAIKVERKVLDKDNASIADALSMQGAILLGRGKLPEAERSLREAVAIYRKAFGGPHHLIGIADVYLALTESQRGDVRAALATLDEAKANYDASYGKLHANHGDLLVNRATILARAGRKREALADCAAGLKILDQTLGADAAYTKASARICAAL